LWTDDSRQPGKSGVISPTPKEAFVEANGINLHYLDWGGNGPALVFLAGMACSAHIFDQFAPRFADRYRVLAMDRRAHGDSDYPAHGYDADTLTEDLRQFLDAFDIQRVILAGHSMACVELCHFTALHPASVLSLVFLDAAYDGTNPEQQALWDNNPGVQFLPRWPSEDHPSLEAYIATVREVLPSLSAIWGPLLEADVRHSVRTTPDHTVIDKMSNAQARALRSTLRHYSPEFAALHGPVLSFFALRDGWDYISTDHMSPEQQRQVLEYAENTVQPFTRQWAQEFQQLVPQAQVALIPNGHHYCFIKNEELVFAAMQRFLLLETPATS